MAEKLCSIEGCEEKHYGKGYCSKHYRRFKKYGDALFIKNNGISKTRAYKSWVEMKRRCNDPKRPQYKHYGARGIIICDRWLESFRNFYEDMGERPEGMTLDRIDNSKGYYKENCRWSTCKTQSENRGLFSKNKTGCSGVCICRGKFRAYIRSKGKNYFLKRHNTFEEAVRARLKGELEHWGYIKQTQFKHLLK